MDANAEIRLAAQLAKMTLTPDEEQRISAAWELTAKAMEALVRNAPDTAPMWYPHEQPCPFREDDAAPSMPREALLSNAPAADEGCFAVPRLVE